MPDMLDRLRHKLFADTTPAMHYYSSEAYRKLTNKTLEKKYPTFGKTMSELPADFSLWLSKDCETFLIALSDDPIAYISDFAYENEEGPVHEISVYVAPEYRHHRLGSKLCYAMIDKIKAEASVDASNTTTDDKLTPAISQITLVGYCDGFAEYVGAKYSYSDYYMVLKTQENESCQSSQSTDVCYDVNSAPNSMTMPGNISFVASNNSKSYGIRMFVDGTSVARMHVNVFDNTLYFSNIYTNKAFRGKGYAGIMMSYAANMHPDLTPALHVSSKNKPAVSCYKKAGFTITESVDYFVFEDF